MIDKYNAAVRAHLRFLYEKVYQVHTKWPHFRRMLEDIESLAASVEPQQTTVCLERAYVYGGDSLFAPLFTLGRFTSVNCELESTNERGAYQKHWLDHPECIHVAAEICASATQTTLPNDFADLLIVPNVVHHIRDQSAMFAEFARILKPGGRGYIFEPLLRELHQIPDDYVRYTPWGFETQFRHHGLKLTNWLPAGGPFEAIAYCWIQAIQYLPEEQRLEKEKWFFEMHFSELMALDCTYTHNLARQHTSFPVAFGIFFIKDR